MVSTPSPRNEEPGMNFEVRNRDTTLSFDGVKLAHVSAELPSKPRWSEFDLRSKLFPGIRKLGGNTSMVWVRRPDLPCARCGVAERQTSSYCYECSRAIRRSNKQPEKNVCDWCGVQRKAPGMGARYCLECREIAPAYFKKRYEPLAKQCVMKNKYGLTFADIEIKKLMQGNRCAICGTTFSTRSAHVDHDHRCCGAKKACIRCLRGMLCQTCNTALGKFGDDISILQRAISYLEDYR